VFRVGFRFAEGGGLGGAGRGGLKNLFLVGEVAHDLELLRERLLFALEARHLNAKRCAQ
jgi:hypothetical protein